MGTQHSFVDMKINVKLKLSMLWASLMLLYIYVDHFAMFMPGTLEDTLKGKIFIYDINQGFLLAALASVSVPVLMIYLCVVLTAKINRCINVILGIIYIPYTLCNLTGEVWMHMVLGAIIEVFFLLMIIYYSWKWPYAKNNLADRYDA